MARAWDRICNTSSSRIYPNCTHTQPRENQKKKKRFSSDHHHLAQSDFVWVSQSEVATVFLYLPPALRTGDAKRTTTMGSRQPTITTGLSISQVHTIAGSVNTAVKNATEAKSYLASKGWMAPGESASMDVLAKVLFAAMVHSAKLSPLTSATIASVAYLLTAKQEEGLLEKLTDTRTYSQVAATTPTHIPTPTPTPLINQICLRNREEIKKQQVLIEFNNADLQLENMSDTVLGRKAKDAIATAWAIAPEPKPTLPGVKAAVLLRNGGLLLKMDSTEVAEWLCDDANRTSVLNNIGSGASIKN